MNKLNKKIIFLLITLFILGMSIQNVEARTKPSKNAKAQVLRTPTSVFDLQQNTVSNIQFYTTNYGIFGNDIANNVGGTVWPRGSLNQYIFGGGIWFAAEKYIKPGDTTLHKLVEVSYDPNSGQSWMVPGRIEEQDLLNNSGLNKYRTYFSTDFRTSDGAALKSADGPNWPIWDSGTETDTLKNERYFGYYIQDETQRVTSAYPKGPAFISGEDIFSTYKDTDLNYFTGGVGYRSNLGYPLRLQFEQMIYSWGYGDYKDFIFMKYVIINKSTDTLHNCWAATVMDADIGRKPSVNQSNDRVKYYNWDTTLNLCVQWTDALTASSGEKGDGFGFLGFNFLESPAVDANGYLRRDKKSYSVNEQLGLKTFKNWNIEDDLTADDARYNALSSLVRDGDNGPGDKRFLMSTGPFNFLPNDTVRVVVGLIMANPSKNVDADGTDSADCAELVRKVKFAQSVYDNNFRAPIPPDKAILGRWIPLDAGIKLTWDSTSEISKDDYEKGLDFLGYRLYRARRSNLDTFNIDEISASNAYPSGKGPLGWKQIAPPTQLVALWEVPTPCYKSYNRAGTNPNNLSMPLIDSMAVIGPVINPVTNAIDTFSIKVMRIGRGFIMAGPYTWVKNFPAQTYTNNMLVPFIMGVDTATLAKPWGTFYSKMSNPGSPGNPGDFPLYVDPTKPNAHHHFLLDSVSVGILQISQSMLSYNPLFWQKQTVSILPKDTSKLANRVGDTIYFKSTYRLISVNGVNTLALDRMVPTDYKTIMKDSVQVRGLLDSVYSYIQRGIAKAKFPDFEQSEKSRFGVIVPYMDSITNHRTYTDIGDDNKDASISYDLDATKTEKLINNVDYYYKLLAYDEGDYNQPTPQKLNSGFIGLPNVATVTPLAAPGLNPVNFKITYIDTTRIGGLYNFNFFGIDMQKVQQLYAGHVFELDFEPIWAQSTVQLLNPPRTKYLGLYARHLTIRDTTTNQKVFDANTYLEVTPCLIPYQGSFTEDALSYVLTDSAIVDPISGKTISFGVPSSEQIDIRSGHFTTGNFMTAGYCYSYGFLNDAYGCLGFSFDFTVEQFGGRLRPDSTEILSGASTTPITFITDIPGDKGQTPDYVITTQQVDFNVIQQQFLGYPDGSYVFQGFGQPINGSFNNGPANYLIEFKPGGTETMKLAWKDSKGVSKSNTFDIPYLTMKVTNAIGYTRPGPNNQPVTVSYPNEIQHMYIPMDTANPQAQRFYPDPRNLKSHNNDFIDKYNLSSWGFVDVRYAKNLSVKNLRATQPDGPLQGNDQVPTGTQGRYYLTGYSQDKADTIDFANTFQASGCLFAFDYARKGRKYGQSALWILDSAQKASYGQDFQVGDKVMLKVAGGALGLPLPGAKVRATIESAAPPAGNYTNDLLDQINIVPNPYYISHQGQQSPYDSKIYFTRLPKQCSIDIYTETGDLIYSFQHDESISTEPDREGMDIWNLLSKNRQRVQSQGLIAIISTPNGAKTIKKFAVVVGGFRLIPE
ncbi:MAG: hypothetical protein ABSG15_00900 [FCB group bacterium]|jgi:hypothetical protein